jgi:hypothetical protein
VELHNFLPKKYRDARLRKNKKILLIIMIIFILLDIVFSITLYNNFIRLNTCVSLNNKTKINKFNPQHNDTKKLKSLTSFMKFENLGIGYKKINVKENMINSDIPANDENEYLKIVEKLEIDKDYRIISISPVKKDNKGYLFNIQLEVIQ